MWAVDSDLFIELPSATSDRVLHHSVIVGMDEGKPMVQPKALLALEEGNDIRIYFERSREFMQQAAKVCQVPEETDEGVLCIEPLGEAVSAEGRECYRVSTVFADLSIEVGNETCSLTDVSVLGLSILGNAAYKSGEIVPVRLTHEGSRYEGNAQVQSIKDLGGMIRYGLLCSGGTSNSKTSLESGLRQVSMTIQRMQLRRRAGA